MFLKNGQIYNIAQPFTDDQGTQYPANFLVGATPEILAEFNIVEVVDQLPKDEAYYYNSRNDDGSYTSVPKSLEQIIAPIKAAIITKRDQLTQGGYTASGKWFHSDPASRTQQLGLALLGANVPVVEWKTMDGTFIPMTQALALEILTSAATSDIAIFKVAKDYIDGLEAITGTPEEIVTKVSAYDWSLWPSVFA